MKRYLDAFLSKYADILSNASEFQKTLARGGFWLCLGGGSVHALRLLRNMILARLLAPEVFGVMAIVMAFNVFFEAFTQVGVKESVIQNPDGGRENFLNSAFWLSTIRSTFLYMLAFISAPILAKLYKSPEVTPIMRIVFLSLFLHGLMSPKAYLALKKMNYRKWVLIFHGSSLAGLTVAICFGIAFRNIWALVIGIITEAFAGVILSYIITPFRPRFHFDRDSAGSLFRFAKGIVGLPVLVFLYNRADIFVIGLLCSTYDLGLYNLAISLVQLPFLLFSTIISPLLLPSFARMQNDREELYNGVVKTLKYVTFAFAPMLIFMAAFSRPLLGILYGDAYRQVANVFSILCLVIMLRILGTVIVTSFFSMGKPQHTRMASTIRTLLMLIVIYPFIEKCGLVGAVLANLLVSTVWISFSVWKFYQILGRKMSFRLYAIMTSGIITNLIIGFVSYYAE